MKEITRITNVITPTTNLLPTTDTTLVTVIPFYPGEKLVKITSDFFFAECDLRNNDLSASYFSAQCSILNNKQLQDYNLVNNSLTVASYSDLSLRQQDLFMNYRFLPNGVYSSRVYTFERLFAILNPDDKAQMLPISFLFTNGDASANISFRSLFQFIFTEI